MRSTFGICLLAVICFSGCDRDYRVTGTVKLTGRVTDGGEPLQVEGREMGLGMITIGFCNNDADRIQVDSAQIDDDGNFELIDGIVPGTYVITVKQWDPFPQVDRLKGRFNERNSKIVREISETSELVIDLSNPEG